MVPINGTIFILYEVNILILRHYFYTTYINILFTKESLLK
jgi:hypothetical protein